MGVDSGGSDNGLRHRDSDLLANRGGDSNRLRDSDTTLDNLLDRNLDGTCHTVRLVVLDGNRDRSRNGHGNLHGAVDTYLDGVGLVNWDGAAEHLRNRDIDRNLHGVRLRNVDVHRYADRVHFLDRDRNITVYRDIKRNVDPVLDRDLEWFRNGHANRHGDSNRDRDTHDTLNLNRNFVGLVDGYTDLVWDLECDLDGHWDSNLNGHFIRDVHSVLNRDRNLVRNNDLIRHFNWHLNFVWDLNLVLNRDRHLIRGIYRVLHRDSHLNGVRDGDLILNGDGNFVGSVNCVFDRNGHFVRCVDCILNRNRDLHLDGHRHGNLDKNLNRVRNGHFDRDLNGVRDSLRNSVGLVDGASINRTRDSNLRGRALDDRSGHHNVGLLDGNRLGNNAATVHNTTAGAVHTTGAITVADAIAVADETGTVRA